MASWSSSSSSSSSSSCSSCSSCSSSSSSSSDSPLPASPPAAPAPPSAAAAWSSLLCRVLPLVLSRVDAAAAPCGWWGACAVALCEALCRHGPLWAAVEQPAVLALARAQQAAVLAGDCGTGSGLAPATSMPEYEEGLRQLFISTLLHKNAVRLSVALFRAHGDILMPVCKPAVITCRGVSPRNAPLPSRLHNQQIDPGWKSLITACQGGNLVAAKWILMNCHNYGKNKSSSKERPCEEYLLFFNSKEKSPISAAFSTCQNQVIDWLLGSFPLPPIELRPDPQSWLANLVSWPNEAELEKALLRLEHVANYDSVFGKATRFVLGDQFNESFGKHLSSSDMRGNFQLCKILLLRYNLSSTQVCGSFQKLCEDGNTNAVLWLLNHCEGMASTSLQAIFCTGSREVIELAELKHKKPVPVRKEQLFSFLARGSLKDVVWVNEHFNLATNCYRKEVTLALLPNPERAAIFAWFIEKWRDSWGCFDAGDLDVILGTADVDFIETFASVLHINEEHWHNGANVAGWTLFPEANVPVDTQKAIFKAQYLMRKFKIPPEEVRDWAPAYIKVHHSRDHIEAVKAFLESFVL
ncbi:hypothetical protein Pelo_7273 [Pelomyxa schiedti]|nr:hypothetical protein Pelo_7273 [Pelomyxa schiedti]